MSGGKDVIEMHSRRANSIVAAMTTFERGSNGRALRLWLLLEGDLRSMPPLQLPCRPSRVDRTGELGYAEYALEEWLLMTRSRVRRVRRLLSTFGSGRGRVERWGAGWLI